MSLLPRCPRCNIAFVDFCGSFAVTCANPACNCGFCADCLADCGADAHPHVLTHGYGYYNTAAYFHQCMRRVLSQRASAVLSSFPDQIRPAIIELLPGILHGNLYGIRPEDFPQYRQAPAAQGAVHHTPGTSEFLDISFTVAQMFVALTVRPNDREYALPLLVESFRRGIDKTKDILFPDAVTTTPALQWMHAAVHCTMADRVVIAPERGAISAELNRRVQRLGDAAGLVAHFEKDLQSKADIVSEIKFAPQYRETLRPEARAAARFYLGRKRLYPQQLWDRVKGMLESFPVLTFLHEKKKSIQKEWLQGTARMAGFLKRLSEVSARQTVRFEEAKEEGSLERLIQNEGDAFRAEFNQFSRDLCVMYPKIKNYECDKTKLREMFDGTFMSEGVCEIPHNVTLATFLVDEDHPGVLARALWTGRSDKDHWYPLHSVQNQLVELVRKSLGSPAVPVVAEVTLQDVMTFDERQVQRIVLDIYVNSDFAPTFSDDLPHVELQTIFGQDQLFRVPLLVDNLPRHSYIDRDMYSLFSEFTAKLQNMPNVTVSVLPGHLVAEVRQIIQTHRGFGSAFFGYCACLLIEMSKRDIALLPKYLQEFEKEAGIPLTAEQSHAVNIFFVANATTAREIKVLHLPALLGLCWDGSLHETCSLPTPPEKRRAISEAAEKIKKNHSDLAPCLQQGLRFLGLSQLCMEQPGFLQMTLAQCVQASMLIFDFDDILLVDKVKELHDIKLCHFADIMAVFEEIIGDCHATQEGAGAPQRQAHSVASRPLKALLRGEMLPLASMLGAAPAGAPPAPHQEPGGPDQRARQSPRPKTLQAVDWSPKWASGKMRLQL